MQRRGWILLVAVVLAMAAVTAALAPTPTDEDSDEPPAADTAPRGAETRRLEFNVTSPAVEEVARGTHVVVEVQTPRPAEVAIPRLGLSGFAEPRTPAVFDVLADRSGRFDVTVALAEGEARRAGTLVVR